MKFTSTVTHLSQKGLGVVKNAQDNTSYFVYGTWPGDSGEFEVLDKPLNNKKFAYARLIKLIQPSRHRQAPPCPYATADEHACTGCSWMIADYANQLEQKHNRFVYAMQRVGFDVASLSIGPVHSAPEIDGYRNRCQVKTDGTRLGFVSENSQAIIPIEDCIVLNDRCRSLLKTAIRQLPNSSWRTASQDDWHFIDLDDDMQPSDIRIDCKRHFKQGNTSQNEWMKSWLKQQLENIAHLGKVVELFCGSGNFTSIIASSDCTSVLGYESDAHAIERLAAKKLTNVTPVMVDLFNAGVWKKIYRQVCDAQTLVLDPPRAGLKKHSGFFDSFTALETILYVSCNPETFARDAWFFKQHGFSPDTIQLIDLFPHTPHIEILAMFRKK